MQYIGNTETIDNDFTIILNHLGIKTMRHMKFENLNESFHHQFERRLKDVSSYFDEETLAKTNEYFKHDFDCFRLFQWRTLYEAKHETKNQSTVFFKTHIAMIQEKKSDILFEKIESDFALFVNYLEKSYKITSNDFVFTQFKEEFSKNFENMKKNKKEPTNNRIELLQNTIDWVLSSNPDFDKEKQHRECGHCHFICYNKTAADAHAYFCIPI
jgi:predicted ribosome quality control (RQC) complex YloA/Tae2 family protein